MRREALPLVFLLLAVIAPPAFAGELPHRVLLFDPAPGSDWVVGMFRHEAADFSPTGWTSVEYELRDVAPDALTYIVEFDVFYSESGPEIEAIPNGWFDVGGTGVGSISGSEVTPRTWMGHLFIATSTDPSFRVAVEIVPSNSLVGGIDLSDAVPRSLLVEGTGAEFSYIGTEPDGSTRIVGAEHDVTEAASVGTIGAARSVHSQMRHEGAGTAWHFLDLSSSGLRLGEHRLVTERNGQTTTQSGVQGIFSTYEAPAHGPSSFSFDGDFLVDHDDGAIRLAAVTVPYDVMGPAG